MSVDKEMKKYLKYRKEIDKIDRKIINLIEKRGSISKEIGIIKKSLSMPLEDKLRENRITKKYKNKNISNKAIASLFKVLFEESKRIQKSKR